MLFDTDFNAFFTDSVEALQPYLNEIVFLGGCANVLYRYHDLAGSVMWDYLGTKDIDMGVPQELPLQDRPSVVVLMEKKGFKEFICGDAADAVIKYGPAGEEKPYDLEFLCSKSGLSKKDQQKAAFPVQEGLYAQPLRYLEMSFNNPWKLLLNQIPGFERFGDTPINIPNPTAYIVSKILIRDEYRKPASMMKDFFYIYEVSVIFRDSLSALKEEYERLCCVPKWKKRFVRNVEHLFSSEMGEGPISAVKVFNDSNLANVSNFTVTEEMVFRSVNRMIKAITGDQEN